MHRKSRRAETQRSTGRHTVATALSLGSERAAHDTARFIDDRREVLGTLEAFGINFIDVFRARRARGEPAIFAHDLEAANRCVIGRRTS